MKLYDATDRVKLLRESYLNYSPMAAGEGRVMVHCDYQNYGTRCLLFTEGWIKNKAVGNTKLRYSAAEAYMLENSNPVITDGELIVGQPDMDWKSRYTAEQHDELKKIYNDFIKGSFFYREGHMALDYTKLLEKGVSGIIEEIDGYLDALDLHNGKNIEKYEFYISCKRELKGLLVLADKYADALEQMANNAEGDKREEYRIASEIMRRIPRYKAETFRDALQSIHFYTFNLLGLYSFGRVDDFLYPYYLSDIKSGRLDNRQAQELIDCFCLLFAPTVPPWAAAGFMLGGVNREGEKVENELTWMFLNSISHTHLPDPGIGFCVTEGTGDEIIDFVSELLYNGESHPAIWNDSVVVNRLIECDVREEDARQYTHSTCVEVTPVGCANWQITSPYVNTLQAFLDAFYTFTDNDTYEDMINKYRASFEKLFDKLLLNVNLGLLEKRRNGFVDPARVSCLVRDCLSKGKYKEDCGAVYNRTACDFLGLSNTAECFNVINQLVFEEKSITISELQKAVDANYDGNEVLLNKIRTKVVHYGNNDEKSDAIARQIADIAIECAEKRYDIYGNRIIPGAFSYDNHVEYGKITKASPDGRLNYEPLHDGSNPVQGYDISGPTALLQSVDAYGPERFLGGIATNIKFSKTNSNLSHVISCIIKGFLKLSIPEIQINSVSADELKKAQETPEKYGNLLVRIGGYSDLFVRLDKQIQDELIRRSENI